MGILECIVSSLLVWGKSITRADLYDDTPSKPKVKKRYIPKFPL
jgi:hypothetical protein